MERFKILGELGEGTFGSVKLGLHLKTGEHVAIKTISKKKLKNKQQILMVEREISIAKCVSHDGLVKLYELIQDEEYLHLVMEYGEQGDLLRWLKKKGCGKEEEVLSIMKQLAEAVNYMHQNKIAHRDIKVANILKFKDDQIKLADFGLSTFYDQFLSTSCGSPCFAAPEVLLSKQYDPKLADTWSIGVVFYCLIEGSLPFYNEKIKTLFDQVISGHYHPTKKMKKSIQLVIKNLLNVNPSERMSLRNLINFLNIKIKEKKHPNLLGQAFANKKLNLSNNIEREKEKLIFTILRINQFEEKNIQDCIQANGKKLTKKSIKHNSLNTFYELLRKKSVQELQKMVQQQRQDEKTDIKETNTSIKDSSLKIMTLNTPDRPIKRRISRTGSVNSMNDSFNSNKRINRRKTMDMQAKNRLIKKQNIEFKTQERPKFKDSYIKMRQLSVFSSLECQKSLQLSSKLNTQRQSFQSQHKRKRIISVSNLSSFYIGNTQSNLLKCDSLNVYKGPFNMKHTIKQQDLQEIEQLLNKFYPSKTKKIMKNQYEVQDEQNKKTKLIFSSIQSIPNRILIQSRPFNNHIIQKIRKQMQKNDEKENNDENSNIKV